MITIIIPVYKVEAYLRRCLDSILCQTFTNFELLLIDDGSPDHSGEICDEYVALDIRVNAIHLSRNGGVSRARNKGLELAKGEWIVFVDADDYVHKDFLQHLLEHSEGQDLVVGGFCKFDSDVYEVFSFEHNMQLKAESLLHFYSEKLDKLIMRTPWGKLFSRRVIDDHGLRFDPSLSLGEDTKFVFSFLRYVRNLQIIKSNEYYFYCPIVFPDQKYRLQVYSIAHVYDEMHFAYIQLSETFSFRCIKFEQLVDHMLLEMYILYQKAAIRKYKIVGYQDHQWFAKKYIKAGKRINGSSTMNNILNYMMDYQLYRLMFFCLRLLFPLIKDVRCFLKEIKW